MPTNCGKLTLADIKLEFPHLKTSARNYRLPPYNKVSKGSQALRAKETWNISLEKALRGANLRLPKFLREVAGACHERTRFFRVDEFAAFELRRK